MRNRSAFSPPDQRREVQIVIGRRLREQFQVLTQATPEPLAALLKRLEASGESEPPPRMHLRKPSDQLRPIPNCNKKEDLGGNKKEDLGGNM
jgi:hypothetical protein